MTHAGVVCIFYSAVFFSWLKGGGLNTIEKCFLVSSAKEGSGNGNNQNMPENDSDYKELPSP